MERSGRFDRESHSFVYALEALIVLGEKRPTRAGFDSTQDRRYRRPCRWLTSGPSRNRSLSQSAVSREQAEHWLGKYSNMLESFIEKGTIEQSIEGLLRTADINFLRRALPTYEANWDKEHRKFGDEAKEFNRLGSQLHPEIFGKAW